MRKLWLFIFVVTVVGLAACSGAQTAVPAGDVQISGPALVAFYTDA